MTELPMSHALEIEINKDRQQGAVAEAIQEKKKKDVNFVTFSGCRPRELTELPAQIEAPQLLHRITKAQRFNVCTLNMF